MAKRIRVGIAPPPCFQLNKATPTACHAIRIKKQTKHPLAFFTTTPPQKRKN